MVFTSVQFLIFFPSVTLLYFLLPHKARWFMLLLASCVFYMAFIPAYIFILLFVICIDYVAGIQIENAAPRHRKLYLLLSILATCAVFFVFKYFDFFAVNFDALARFLDWNYSVPLLGLLLPIGLSFHTFQSLSYVFEIYKGRQKAERHFGIYALYVMFYPQLVAGPIERPQHLLHQFREVHSFDYTRVADGLKRIALGFFKKIVIADNLATYVNQVYSHPHEYHGIALLIATVFFAIEIYCDFSGYSDIAIGAAKVMGFNLIENFKNPYFATSIQDFWRRWHISLSTWFRDYVYIPLGGSRVGALKWCRNIIITLAIAGLWHGANWTYIIWGLLHGSFYIFSRATESMCARVVAFLPFMQGFVGLTLRRLGIFAAVLIAWVFFRANGLADALYVCRVMIIGTLQYLANMITGIPHITSSAYFHAIADPPLMPLYQMSHGRIFFSLLLCAVIAFLAIEIIDYRRGVIAWVNSRPAYVRWPLYALVFLAIMNLGNTHEIPFIYFQF